MQPPADSILGTAAIIHYTWGMEFKVRLRPVVLPQFGDCHTHLLRLAGLLQAECSSFPRSLFAADSALSVPVPPLAKDLEVQSIAAVWCGAGSQDGAKVIWRFDKRDYTAPGQHPPVIADLPPGVSWLHMGFPCHLSIRNLLDGPLLCSYIVATCFAAFVFLL